MYKRGSASWRFGHGDMGYLRSALLVRDAAGLPVAAAGDIPPRLAENVPDHREVLAPGDGRTAGQQWVVWWRRLVSQAAREGQRRWTAPPGDDVEARLRMQYVFEGQREVFDPPDFASLTDLEPLRSAVRAVFGMPPDRSDSRRRGPDRRIFEFQLVRDVAERTAVDLGVPVSDVTGYAHVIDVEGLWWYLAGPGCVLCSAEAASDLSTAARILREVFTSGLSPDETA
jgi:hypothetical protein